MFNYNYGDIREAQSRNLNQAAPQPSNSNAELDELDHQISEIRERLARQEAATSLPLEKSCFTKEFEGSESSDYTGQIQAPAPHRSSNTQERLNQLDIQLAEMRVKRLAEKEEKAFSHLLTDSNAPQLQSTYDQPLLRRREASSQIQTEDRLQQKNTSIPSQSGISMKSLQELTHDLSEARKNMELQIALIAQAREQLNHFRYPTDSQILSDFPQLSNNGDESDEIHSLLGKHSPTSQNDIQSFLHLSESDESVPELEQQLEALYKQDQLEQKEVSTNRKRTAQQTFSFMVPPIEELSESERRALEDRSYLRPTKRAQTTPSSFQPTKQKPIREIKIGEWSYEEVENLIKGVSTYGFQWDLIAMDCLKGRKTALQCETYFKSLRENAFKNG